MNDSANNDRGDRAAHTGRRRDAFGRRLFLKGAAIGVSAAAADSTILKGIVSAATNTVRLENQLDGTDEWDLPSLDDSIEGFAAEFSVNAGETVHFKIRTVATNYRVDIYRLGWYGGLGGRKVATLTPSVALPQVQPDPIVDSYSGLIDCGNWGISCFWPVPASAVSGVYVANMVRLDEPEHLSNRMIFVVRNDGRKTDLLVQTSDTTYQAYNDWGGNSLYTGTANWDRAVKVSYNRPSIITELENDFWYAEYPFVRWLERNGFDVAYSTCVDTDRRGSELLNHKIFVSSGHDEYWSKAQRENVESARDAGVHLIFMTGNEVFWKVRWDSDNSGTPYRTLVCYKETLAGAKIDPNSEWTGTWRDDRFSPPSDGGRPESALTGTLFKGIIKVEDSDFSIEVPHTFSQMRFWRHTSIAHLAPGETATLSRDTLGYEFNTDDFTSERPPGLIRLSETTVVIDQVLRDHGKIYTPGPVTHYMTMYRAASSALVWSTGTVQWSWGLDNYHPNRPNIPVPVDVRMQQATLNVLADMGVMPTTLQPGLVPASQSTDTQAPITTIEYPPVDHPVAVGSVIVISGSCVDASGVVASVEVSIDGGTTWQPAAGTTSWSYPFMPTRLGPTTVLVRGVDDGCNIESPKAIQLVGVPREFPCSLWTDDSPPPAQAILETTPLELGVRFRSSEEGFVTGLRFYKIADNTGLHQGRLWRSDGRLLAVADFQDESDSGWQTVSLAAPVALAADTTYIVSYTCPTGRYSADPSYFASEYALAPLSSPASTEQVGNGLYGSPGSCPDRTFGATNYWVDVVFDLDNHAVPTIVDYSPAHGVSAVDVESPIHATFDEAMAAGSIVVVVRDLDESEIAGSIQYDRNLRRATFTPESPLAELTTFEVTLAGAHDTSGESIAGPITWEFTTTGPLGSVPTTIWTSSAIPTIESVNDDLPVELGLRFRSDVDGVVTAVRFYKGELNTGTHLGHLWSPTGQLLGTATFTNESRSGWQEARFEAPIPITAGIPYVVSYYAPKGGYGADLDYFESSSRIRGPLRAPSTIEAGPNGLYRYGLNGGFPTSSYRSCNYWVDVVLAVPADLSAPSLVNWIPATGLQGVGAVEPIVVTFDRPISAGDLQFTVSSGGTPISGTVTVDTTQRSASFTPSEPLPAGTLVAVTVNTTSASGVAMVAPFDWTFTTATRVGETPATLWETSMTPAVVAADDVSAVQLGLKFRSDVDGVITALRFYKGPGNAGPHVGKLWTSNGELLGSVNFEAETAIGWQQANFAAPVPISAGSTYVASYHAPVGRYSANPGGLASAVYRPPLQSLPSSPAGGNGVYRYGTDGFPVNSFGATSYLVDVVFADSVGPQVTVLSPEPGAQDVALDASISATFGEPMRPQSITIDVRDAHGSSIPGTVAYDASNCSATFVQSGALAPNSAYTARVTSAKDLAGNDLTPVTTWSFTTRNTALVTLFGNSTPAVASNDDSSALELGLRFMASQSGGILGVRFYKGPANSGPHVGRLWTASGEKLAEAEFVNESGSGWQVAQFESPVAVVPGEHYVVSYYAPNGGFSLDYGYFSNGDIESGPLTAIGTSSAPNGLFRYGAGGGFPTGSVGGSNYWVDVLFSLGSN